MNVLHLRRLYLPTCTLGVLTGHDIVMFTMEKPWKDNARNISCIPEGTYDVVPNNSPTFGESFLVKDVPNRSHILFHGGNYVDDTQGCILPGLAIVDLNKDDEPDVGSSRAALRQLLLKYSEGFKLIITAGDLSNVG